MCKDLSYESWLPLETLKEGLGAGAPRLDRVSLKDRKQAGWAQSTRLTLATVGRSQITQGGLDNYASVLWLL